MTLDVQGGEVRDFIDDGHVAVGLEGSDWSKKLGRAEWGRTPTLFTANITKPFDLFENERPVKFDVVTAWEVMEHIAEHDLPQLTKNVLHHLANGGLWIMSISTEEEIIDGRKLHQTVKPKGWWLERFNGLGFSHHEKLNKYFNGHFVRTDPGSFHLVLTRKNEQPPEIPRESFKERFYDKWCGSKPQKIIKNFFERLLC